MRDVVCVLGKTTHKRGFSLCSVEDKPQRLCLCFHVYSDFENAIVHMRGVGVLKGQKLRYCKGKFEDKMVDRLW